MSSLDSLQEPTPPGDYDCCESGCEPCVWDIYYADRAEWQKQQSALKAAQISKEDQSTAGD
jgi:hypothetical protein